MTADAFPGTEGSVLPSDLSAAGNEGMLQTWSVYVCTARTKRSGALAWTQACTSIESASPISIKLQHQLKSSLAKRPKLLHKVHQEFDFSFLALLLVIFPWFPADSAHAYAVKESG